MWEFLKWLFNLILQFLDDFVSVFFLCTHWGLLPEFYTLFIIICFLLFYVYLWVEKRLLKINRHKTDIAKQRFFENCVNFYLLSYGWCFCMTFIMTVWVTFDPFNPITDFLSVTPYTWYVKYFIMFLMLCFGIFFGNWLKNENKKSMYTANVDLLLFLNISVLGMFLVISSANFFFVFLGLELQILPYLIMTYFDRYNNKAVESGLKYFIYSCFFSLVAFIGLCLIYSVTGTLNINELLCEFQHALDRFADNAMRVIVSDGHMVELPPVVEGLTLVGLCFIFISLAFKLGLAPFHFWLPEIYPNVPTIILLFFLIVPKITILYLLINCVLASLIVELGVVCWVIASLGILTMIIGSLAGLFADQFKKFMVYSSIVHMGFFMLCVLGPGAYVSEYFYLYILFYVLSVSFLSVSVFVLRRANCVGDSGIITDLSALSSVRVTHGFLALIITLHLFSLAGVPPFLCFWGKLPIIYSSITGLNDFFTYGYFLCTLVSMSYYIKLIRILWFGELTNNENHGVKYTQLTFDQSFYLCAFGVLTFLCMFVLLDFVVLNSLVWKILLTITTSF